MATTTAQHLTHRVRWTYDCRGNGWPHCLECDVPVPTIWRTCPRCGVRFDGTGIGATLEARILCADCSATQATGDCGGMALRGGDSRQ